MPAKKVVPQLDTAVTLRCTQRPGDVLCFPNFFVSFGCLSPPPRSAVTYQGGGDPDRPAPLSMFLLDAHFF